MRCRRVRQLLILVAILLVTAPSLFSQERLSLAQAITIARKQNPSLVLQRIKAMAAQARYEREVMASIPNLSVSSYVQRNMEVASTPIPAKIFNPSASDGDIFPAKFGTDYSGTVGVDLEYDLFNPIRYGSVREQRLQSVIAQLDEKAATEALAINVSLDYATAVIASEQTALCQVDTLQAYRSLVYVHDQYAEGRVAEEELLRARQEYNLSQSRLLQAYEVRHEAMVKLLTDLGRKADPITVNQLILVDSIPSLMDTPLDKELMGLAQQKDSLNLRLKAIDLTRSKLSLLPTLSLTGHYGGTYYANNLKLLSRDAWFGHSFIGLKVTYPISGLATVFKDIRMASIAYDEAIAERRQSTLERDNNLQHQRQSIILAEQHLNLSRSNMELADRQYLIMKERLKEGRIDPTQLVKSRYDRQKRRADYLQALYDYFAAKAQKHLLELSL